MLDVVHVLSVPAFHTQTAEAAKQRAHPMVLLGDVFADLPAVSNFSEVRRTLVCLLQGSCRLVARHALSTRR